MNTGNMEKLSVIIAFTGKKGSGKDTAAFMTETIIHELGLFRGRRFFRTSFAKPIKDALNIIFDWDDSAWEHGVKEVVDKRWGVSPRQMAQHLGTDWAQTQLNKDYPLFAHTTGRRLWVHRALSGKENLIITDMRFPHEEKTVREYGGYVIKLVKPEVKEDEPVSALRSFLNRFSFRGEKNHTSETSVDDIQEDYLILNEGSIDDLSREIKRVLFDLNFIQELEYEEYLNNEEHGLAH